MPKLNAEARLFGVDLKQAWYEVQQALRQLTAWSGVSKWLPISIGRIENGADNGCHVRLRGEDWQETLQADGHKHVKHQAAPSKIFVLEEAYVLERMLQLPPMPLQALQAVLALEVQALSPFAEQETLWAYRLLDDTQTAGSSSTASTSQKVLLVMTSHALMKQAMDQAQMRDPQALEVWFRVQSGQPLLLTGFGESPRLAKEKKQRNYLLAGAVALAVLVLAVAITPTLQLRYRAIDAYRQLQTLAASTQDLVQQRQQLQSALQALATVEQTQAAQIDHVWLLQQLTQTLPDDVVLQSFALKKNVLTAQGYSDNASAVVQLLSAVPGFREVRLTSAVTRVPNSQKESFALSAEISTQAYKEILGHKDAQTATGTGAQAQ